MRTASPRLRSTAVVAAMALCAFSATAQNDVASIVFANGEAMSPESEARLRALTTTPGGAVTRSEVLQQLAQASSDGTLAEAGELADPPAVLVARLAANARQTGEILAAYAAERERGAAIEAAAEVRRQAELLARQASPASGAPTQTVASTDSTSVGASVGALPASAGVDPVGTSPLSTERPVAADVPGDTPIDTPAQDRRESPALAPVEVPIPRPSDLPDEVLLDKD